ncbi:LysR family transcriptional regulator [Shewanella intestini]|uniref:LysR family transcriptional regulator n=1 Tax=Shewanella intestini TaxID=2017544 RepID=A0ABS5HXY6_9GAMM|nr:MULTISPECIES: LysR family transcriptional regulator [Shewanella]MBR9726556.1 LysR family transcriptional regulator [Shewanella intestini]MRG34878.1 LysR family transcriptional regulator [Shewanella sp. XMDDZSB0408]
MNLKALHHFIHVVDAGGFAKASKVAFLTQPALSKSISLLEGELEMVLLERGKRGTQVKMTAAGEIVYRYAQSLLSGRKQMLRELDSLRNLDSGTLRLGLAPLGSAELFAPAIAKFRQMHPKVELQLLVRGGVEQTLALQKDEIELATGIIDFNDEFDGLRVREEPMVVVLPKTHPLSTKNELHLYDIKPQAQVMFEREYTLYEMVLDACEKAGVGPTEITRVSHADFGIALVAAGTGIMILPQIIAERYRVDAVVNVPLSTDDLVWELSLFWNKNKPLSFAAKAMASLINEHLFSEPLKVS